MEHTFTVKDATGTSHTYTLQRHRGSEGAPIALRMLATIVEPLAVGAGKPMIAGLGKIRGKGLTGIAAFSALAALPEVQAAVDMEKLGRSAAAAVTTMRLPFMLQVLLYTNRDGKPLVDSGQASGHFDQAYAANYTELGTALYKVCSVNGFFPGLSTIADGVSKALKTEGEPPKSDG